MITWIRDNWRWAALNAIGLAVMASLLSRAAEPHYYEPDFTPLIDTAKWAVRFLLFSLLMSPLNTYLGWRSAVGLRKTAGLWAFAFGCLHFALYISDPWSSWLQDPIPHYMAALGLAALAVLAAMAITSNRWAMRRLGKWWKRLHRLIYAASLVALAHALLEAGGSKRAMTADSSVGTELTVYLAILVVLLLVRIPAVRSRITGLRGRFRGLRTSGESAG